MWKGKYSRPNKYYPIYWNRMRFKIFSYYNYNCKMCGKYSKNDLHLHHIIPVGCGGNHHSDNLVPLCSKCHELVHSGNYNGPYLILKRRKNCLSVA